jgi:hypothetical protein
MNVPRAQVNSWESVLHEAEANDKLLLMDELRPALGIEVPRGHRAIGVIYHPTHEAGNYVPSVMADRYDAFLYFDETEALHPLHIQPESTEPPETYPWGSNHESGRRQSWMRCFKTATMLGVNWRLSSPTMPKTLI